MTKELNLLDIPATSKKTSRTRCNEIKRIIEALLFSTNEPLSTLKLKEIISTTYPIQNKEIANLIEEIRKDYQNDDRSFQIDEIGGGYLLRTVEEMKPYVEQLHQDRRSEKLSRASTEVLAIVAYRQPITRKEIDSIRGVDSSGSVVALQERGLIKIVGRKEAPGKPAQYGITKKFLAHFGLKDLKDLIT